MLQGRPREFVKRLLELSRAKLVFDRITQTRYTRLYFFLSALTCLLLCALQAVILFDNTKAVDILTAAVEEADPPAHITVLKDGELQVCDAIPDKQDSNCIVLWLSDTPAADGPFSVQRRSKRRHVRTTKVPRQAVPAEEESESSDDDGGVSSDDEGGVSSDDEEGESDDEAEEDEEEAEEEGGAQSGTSTPTTSSTSTSTATTSSTSPTATVTASTTASGATSVTITSISASGATSVTVSPTPTSTATPGQGPLAGISLDQRLSSPHSMRCIYSMSWLEETLHDSQREDVATLFFQVWLFGLSLVAILNESLPHLGAAFAGHVLAAGWSSSRIQGAKSLAKMYRDIIIAGPCEGADLLGSWWELRLAHTIPVVVFNIIGALGLGFLSYKLLKVYSAASFSKVGPTRTLQRVYKLVLLFSVALQLSGFFTAVSSGLWLSKVAHGNFKALSRHAVLYIVAFVVILVAEVPWLILGWVCSRKECRKRFWVFAVLSAILLAISSVMFNSDAYRTIFESWRFFATVTVTAFVLLVLTILLGLLCYFNYGKGLRQYLQMAEEPAGADFTPVAGYLSGNGIDGSEKQHAHPFPESFYGAPALYEKNGDLEWSSPTALPKPPSAAEVSQYLSRGTAPAQSPLRQAQAVSNPFESDLDRAADSRLKSVWSVDSSLIESKSGWSANSSDIDARSYRTLPSPRTSAGAGAPPFLLQPPPRALGPQATRVASFNGTMASLEPFEGMPVPPITPMAPPSREGSVRSITRSPFPTAPVNVDSGRHSRNNSMRSVNSVHSVRSIRQSPFPTAPVHASAIARSNTSLSRDSGYSKSSSDQSSVAGRYLSSSPFNLAVDMPRSVRESMVSSVAGEYQVANEAVGKRETLGVGTPLIQEVPRNLYIANQV